jgi:cytochrome c-type biogenesis protein
MGPELALAFSAGMVATVNPCGFALLPAYLSYFLGLEDDSLGDGTGGSGRAGPVATARRAPVVRALAVSAAVTLGFLVVFAVMGFAWSSVSGVIGQRLPWFTLVVGAVLVVLGIAMLRGFEPVVRLPRLQLSADGRQLGSMFLYGVSYAIASLSCTIPIFIGIVSTTLERQSFLAGMSTFVAYGLGMGMTLSILTIAVALARSGIVRNFRRILPHINTISGVLLVVAGLFVSYYAWVELRELRSGGSSGVVSWSRDLQSSMQRWVEGVGGGRLALAAAIIIAAALVITWILRPDQRSPDRTGGAGSDAADSEDTDPRADREATPR